MSYEPFDTMLDKNPTPQEYITEMFERTDENGILYLPASHTFTGVIEPEPDYDYRCGINWNLSKYELVLKKFTTVFEAIKRIAPFENELRYHPEKAKVLLKDPELYQVWYTYVRPFDVPQFDRKRISDISDRYEYIALAQEIAMRFANGKKLNGYEREILEEHLNTDVSDEDEKYMENYHCLREMQTEERIGNNYFAYETILFAQRLCRLIYLGAPDIIVNNEGRRFAQHFVLHEYGTSVMTASSAIREQKEKLEQMSDEELDEIDRERPQTNSAKSLLPLFVHQILGQHSSAEKHLHQQTIIDYLKQPPYEIKVERKAISRTLYTLNNWFSDSILCDKDGWWKE